MAYAQSESPEEVKGTVERVTYRNPENGYSVIQIRTDDGGKRLTAVGICPQARVGSYVILHGRKITHPKFGEQFEIHSLTEAPPSTVDGIERYLASGVIVGIGKKTAERIVKEFGADTLDVIRTAPEKIAALPGVGLKKAEILTAAIQQQTEFDVALRFLVEHKISPSLSAKIYERFKNKTVEIVRADPYVLAREIRGVGFHTADIIALNLGIQPDSPKRLRAGLYFALEDASFEGHCYLSRQALYERGRTLLGIEDSEELVEQIDILLAEGAIVSYEGGMFLPTFNDAEASVAQFVAERSRPRAATRIDEDTVREVVTEAETSLGVSLSPEQQLAVSSAARYPMLIITGGPGCGKTTVIKAVTLLFQKLGFSLALAAPTGRAAQRMTQVCGQTASTIHRLLKFDPSTNHFVFNAKNPLPLDALIIDEASMVDILLARDLFEAIPLRCTLILVGDKDQLPSVGPGRVFGDLVGARDIRVIQLSKLFRRAEESYINTIAYMINTGAVPAIPTPDGVTKSDAYFIQRDDTEEASKLIENLVADQIPKKFGFTGNEIAVLTPSNRGPLGTIELNRKLQERLNPRAAKQEHEILPWNDTFFTVGDRVCQRVNNYKIDLAGVFNGDMGTVMSVDRTSNRMTVELWDGRLIDYEKTDIGQLSLAYAMTVHRSQGMEVPCVVLTIDTSHFTLLERQLVYTGVTRAKKLLIIVGSKKALAMASKRTNTKRRGTLLLERIERALSPSQLSLSLPQNAECDPPVFEHDQ
jgi:exodeoxyribonuclease V alpha subunit